MAVKKDFRTGAYTWQDLYDTQDALDSGEIKNTIAGGTDWSSKQTLLGMKTGSAGGNIATYANKDNFASVLSQTGGQDFSKAIGAYKERKLEQKTRTSQGVGRSMSILGGTVV